MNVKTRCRFYPYQISRNHFGGQKEDKNLERKIFIINFVIGN